MTEVLKKKMKEALKDVTPEVRSLRKKLQDTFLDDEIEVDWVSSSYRSNTTHFKAALYDKNSKKLHHVEIDI